MKNLLLLLPLFLLVACSTPQKYLNIGEYELAFDAFLKKAKYSNSPKVIDGLLESYAALNKVDDQLINEWEAKGALVSIKDMEASVWPRIKGRLDRVQSRQTAVLQTLATNSNLNGANINHFPALESRLEKSNNAAAEYYHHRFLEAFQKGISGNKKEARIAFDLGIRTLEYGNEDPNLEEQINEVKVIGTDYVLMTTDSVNLSYDDEFIWERINQKFDFPIEGDWMFIDNNISRLQRVDYYLDVIPSRTALTPGFVNVDQCTNEKDIKVGTKTEQEWSEIDSAFVDVQIDIFERVSVTVFNYEQVRSASGKIDIALYAADSDNAILKTNFVATSDWSNNFSEVQGDERALSVDCVTRIGWSEDFPSDAELLGGVARRAHYKIKKFFKKELFPRNEVL